MVYLHMLNQSNNKKDKELTHSELGFSFIHNIKTAN